MKQDSGKKIFIKSFGCQMNEYDASRMVDLMREHDGMTQTDNMEEADVILLNTCSVREKAEEKVFSHLGRMIPLKEKNPNLVIGVGGCVASQEGDAIIKRAPYVDVVFGPQTLHRLPDLIKAKQAENKPQVDITFPEIEKFDHLPPPRIEGATAFLSIMEGCSKYCSFCVVPYTRGEEFSRPFEDILTEAIQLAEQGVKEITLLGQNVNAYRVQYQGIEADLALLIETVAEIPQIERIRYTTSHPNEFSQRLIDVYGRVPQLVNHLHLPVQHGADRILSAMKRGYTALEYKSIIRKLRAVRPDISLSTDFIVGFPGETDEDFEKSMKLIDDVGFDASFSFIFSARPGTPAAALPDDTPQDVKLARLQRLQARLEENVRAISAARVGTVQRILVEGPSRRNAEELMGRTECNRIVNFAGPARLIGQMVDVTITEAFPHSLRAEVLVRDSVAA